MDAKNAVFYDPQTERLDVINEDLSIIQSKKGLTFGTDSYLLAAFSKANRTGVCAEFGGGTGVVSLLCAARKKYSKTYCIEVMEYYYDLIRRNTKLNSLDSVILPVHIDIRHLSEDYFGNSIGNVIMNPPYMKPYSGRNNKNPDMNSARREINGSLKDFVCAASRVLKHGGYLDVVMIPDRMSELLRYMSENMIEPKKLVIVYPYQDSKPCLVLCEGKKGAAYGLTVSRPLIIYSDRNNGYTSDMSRIYEDFSLEHLFETVQGK